MNRLNLPAALAAIAILCAILFLASRFTAAQPRPPAEISLGAAGDGKSDDTAPLQRVLNAGGAVHLTRGTYRITKPLIIELDKTGFTSLIGDGVARIVMAGPGPALRFIGTHFKSADPPNFEPRVWQTQRMPLVDGLEIIGDHAESVGIEAVGTMQLTITRTRMQGLLHGVHLIKNNRNILIADCHIYDNVDLHQSNVVGCHISYNKGGGIVTRGGMVRNLQVGTCDIEANQDTKGAPTANILLDSTGGSTGEVAIVGCTIQHADNTPNSANIRVIGKGKAQNQTDTEEGHITIGENVLSDVRINIDLHNARGVTITGNTFWMGFDHNLVVEDCSNIVVGPNNMDRNPRYAHSRAETSTGSVIFRRTRDCTITGLHVNGSWHDPAAIVFEDCSRLNITALTILDSDNINLLLKNVTNSRVSGCLIRDDRPDAKSLALKITGGKDNAIGDNLFGRPTELDPDAQLKR